MAIDPRRTNNFLDSCAFDPKYEPEASAAQEVYQRYQRGEFLLQIAHSTQKEIEHPNTPVWVKEAASGSIFTLDVQLTSDEKELLAKIEALLAGSGKVENVQQDARHVFEAQKYGSNFITTDERILRRRGELRSLCSVSILKPSELLELLASFPSSDPRDPSSDGVQLLKVASKNERGNDPMMVAYEGYLLRPIPLQRADTGEWTTRVEILRDAGASLNVKLFFAGSTWATRDEALGRSVEFAKRIIDGEIHGCSVDDL